VRARFILSSVDRDINSDAEHIVSKCSRDSSFSVASSISAGISERNRLVGTFLHKLEYFEGFLFLTTNLPNDFDLAILNRVHLSLQYDLGRDGRKAIFRHFLQKHKGTPANVGDDELNSLPDVALNGRQVAISHNWSSIASAPTLTAVHI
jgi:hypothetical protein